MKPIGRSYNGSILLGLGLLGLYVGERLIGAGTQRGVVSAIGALLLLVAFALRLIRWRGATGEAKDAERVLLGLDLLVVIALVLYLVRSDLLFPDLATKSARFATVLAVLWPALLAVALLPILLIELSYAAMAQPGAAPVIERERIRDALFSGLGIAFTLIFVFTAVYVFTERDAKWDLSYFRTARPGTATENLVASLDEPVDVSLFFPPANDVREELRSYFDALAKQSPNLRVHDYDQAVDLAKAKELGVSGNGTVVIARGGRKELMQFGQRLETARTQLRNLDRDAQKALLKVVKSKRVLYVTTGHGERAEAKSGVSDQRSPTALLREGLMAQNYELRPLGPAEGLAADVPADAAAVMMFGPTSEPLREEQEALSRYFAKGGRLFIALDPEANVKLDALFAPLGIQYDTTTLANDEVFIAQRHTLADRAWILVGSYSSHPAVTTLSNNGSRLPMGLLGAGSWETTKDRPHEVTVDFTVHAHPATFDDKNGNFAFDPPGEQRKAWEVAAAVTRKPKPDSKPEDQGRMVLLADSDAVSDAVIRNEGNLYFVLDGLRWLFGEESLQGETSSEVDVPVEHTRKQDVAWFYSTVFLIPAAILGVGFAMTRRRTKAPRVAEAAR